MFIVLESDPTEKSFLDLSHEKKSSTCDAGVLACVEKLGTDCAGTFSVQINHTTCLAKVAFKNLSRNAI